MALSEDDPLARAIARARRDVEDGAETYHSGQVGHAYATLQLVTEIIEPSDSGAAGLRRALTAINELARQINHGGPTSDPAHLRALRDRATAAIDDLIILLAAAAPTPRSRAIGLDW